MIGFLTRTISKILLLAVAIMLIGGSFTPSIAQSPSTDSDKKAIPSEKKSAVKKPPVTHLFNGVVEKVDLQDHPMTLAFKSLKRSRRKTVFTGDLTPQTIVFEGGKSVGVKALKKGEKVYIFYQKTLKKLSVVKVRILLPRVVSNHHK
jgi:Cu/Ag efflux protein CusF